MGQPAESLSATQADPTPELLADLRRFVGTLVGAQRAILARLTEHPEDCAGLRRLALDAAPGERRVSRENPDETVPLSIHQRVVELLEAQAGSLEGVSTIFVSPDAHEIVFSGPERTPERVDACNELVREIQRKVAPGWVPLLRGSFRTRGLDALEGYARIALHP